MNTENDIIVDHGGGVTTTYTWEKESRAYIHECSYQCTGVEEIDGKWHDFGIMCDGTHDYSGKTFDTPLQAAIHCGNFFT